MPAVRATPILLRDAGKDCRVQAAHDRHESATVRYVSAQHIVLQRLITCSLIASSYVQRCEANASITQSSKSLGAITMPPSSARSSSVSSAAGLAPRAAAAENGHHRVAKLLIVPWLLDKPVNGLR